MGFLRRLLVFSFLVFFLVFHTSPVQAQNGSNTFVESDTDQPLQVFTATATTPDLSGVNDQIENAGLSDAEQAAAFGFLTFVTAFASNNFSNDFIGGALGEVGGGLGLDEEESNNILRYTNLLESLKTGDPTAIFFSLVNLSTPTPASN